MNLRQAITRNVTYSIVTITIGEGVHEYTVYGSTSPIKEMKKYLKSNPISVNLPTFEVKVITEQRAISIDKFIEHSEIVKKEENSNNESEEN